MTELQTIKTTKTMKTKSTTKKRKTETKTDAKTKTIERLRSILGEGGLASKDPKTRQETWFLLVFAVISLILFYSFIYNDILETMRVGISLWDELVEGNLRYFYGQWWHMDPVAYTKDVQAVYDFPIYIVFALWNIPLWLLERFAGVDVFTSVPCLMWGKTILLVATWLLVQAMWRLCRALQLDEDTSRLVCILFLTSNFYLTSVIVMSAYDILAMYCTLEGIRCYYEGSMRGFVLWFMWAIPLKFFALLLYVSLLLLKEKRILRIVGYLVAAMALLMVCRLLIPCGAVAGDPSSVALSLTNILESTDLSGLSIWYVLMYDEELVLDSVYPSVIAFLLVFLVCYIIRLETQEQLQRWGIYMCFLTYAVMFVTCFSHPYWLLIMVPFAAILIGQNRQYLYINVLVDTFSTWGMILAQMFRFPWCYGSGVAAGMFWPLILGSQETYSAVTPLTIFEMVTESETGQSYIIAIGGSLFMAGTIAFAVINFPGRQYIPAAGSAETSCAVGKDAPSGSGPAGSGNERKEFPRRSALPLIERDYAALNWMMVLRVFSGFVIAMVPLVLYAMGVWMQL